jgi:hypothetical protein
MTHLSAVSHTAAAACVCAVCVCAVAARLCTLAVDTDISYASQSVESTCSREDNQQANTKQAQVQHTNAHNTSICALFSLYSKY